jgi:hypothetical protein
MALVSEGATWTFGVNKEFFGLDYTLPGLRFVTIMITPLEESGIDVKIPGILEGRYRKSLTLKLVSSKREGTFNLILNGTFLTSVNCPIHESGNMRVAVKGPHQVEYPSCRYEY